MTHCTSLDSLLKQVTNESSMFHQANLRQTDVASSTINGVTAKRSLLQMWTQTVVDEMVRL